MIRKLRAARRRNIIFGVGAFFSVTWLLQLKMGNNTLGSVGLLPNLTHSPMTQPEPTIFNNVQDMPAIASSGPTDLNPEISGMYQFDNVCLTRHDKSGNIQGLIYLDPGNEAVARNKKRCIPCSRPIDHEGGWWGKGRDQPEVGHICGFQGKKQ